MAREVREEVGLEVVGTARMLGLYARFRHGSSDHVSVFVVDEWSGTPKTRRAGDRRMPLLPP